MNEEKNIASFNNPEDCFGKEYDANDALCVGSSTEPPCNQLAACKKYYTNPPKLKETTTEVVIEESVDILEETKEEENIMFTKVREGFEAVDLKYLVRTDGRGTKFVVKEHVLVTIKPEGIKIRIKPSALNKANIFMPSTHIRESASYFVLLEKYICGDEGFNFFLDVLHYYKEEVCEPKEEGFAERLQREADEDTQESISSPVEVVEEKDPIEDISSVVPVEEDKVLVSPEHTEPKVWPPDPLNESNIEVTVTLSGTVKEVLDILKLLSNRGLM